MGEIKTKSLMPEWVPAFNKKFGNKVQGLWAPYLPPWAVILHVGRSSGKPFQTPVMAFKRGDKLYVNLIYGTGAHWAQNVLAAGEAEVVRAGRKHRLINPTVVVRSDFNGPLPFQTKFLGSGTAILVVELG
jgi:deazaflavin-dependent oxidoreductase (nitroreductase family)